jgi:hypothetical protein
LDEFERIADEGKYGIAVLKEHPPDKDEPFEDYINQLIQHCLGTVILKQEVSLPSFCRP